METAVSSFEEEQVGIHVLKGLDACQGRLTSIDL